MTVIDAFKRICSMFPKKPALRVKRNNKWEITKFDDYYANVTHAAKSLILLGLKPHHGICILGFNSPKWHISYLAGIMVSLILIYTFVVQVFYTDSNVCILCKSGGNFT